MIDTISVIWVMTVFAVVFTVARTALRESGFEASAQFVLAMCVGLLSALGAADLTRKGTEGGISVFLIPYQALGIAALVGLVLWLCCSRWPEAIQLRVEVTNRLRRWRESTFEKDKTERP